MKIKQSVWFSHTLNMAYMRATKGKHNYEEKMKTYIYNQTKTITIITPLNRFTIIYRMLNTHATTNLPVNRTERLFSFKFNQDYQFM